ncbi:hypothetical protein RYX36_009314, partial [Vicia faba]
YSSILGPNNDKLPTQDEAIELFQLWKKENGRVYNDVTEMSKRFGIFLSNLRIITNANRKRKSSHDILLGPTNFADLSSKEFQESYLHELDLSDNTMKLQDDVELQNFTLPASVDWVTLGAVTDPMDQKDCNCCWAISAAGAIEGISKIKTGNLIKLSVQELVDCDSGSRGCEGGYVKTAYDWVINNNGITDEDSYPFTARKGPTCRSSMTKPRATISSYMGLDETEKALLIQTAQQPISSCLYAIPEDFQHYTGGIYEGLKCPEDPKLANHCMLIVGYNTESKQDYWLVKNSMGAHWGMEGYMFIKRNNG